MAGFGRSRVHFTHFQCDAGLGCGDDCKPHLAFVREPQRGNTAEALCSGSRVDFRRCATAETLREFRYDKLHPSYGLSPWPDSRSGLGSGKCTSSLRTVSSRIVAPNFSTNQSIVACTTDSGALAPAVTSIRSSGWNQSTLQIFDAVDQIGSLPLLCPEFAQTLAVATILTAEHQHHIGLFARASRTASWRF